MNKKPLNDTIKETYVTLLHSKMAMERENLDLVKQLDELQSELKNVEKVIDLMKKENPDLISIAITSLPDKNSSTWANSVKSILIESTHPLLFGQIVDKIFEKGMNKGLPKINVQRRVNGQLNYMFRNNTLSKTKSENGNLYSLID